MTNEIVPTEIVDAEVVPMTSLESTERAQTDIQISTAKQYPRNIQVVKQKMLSFATLDEETAASCFYSLPRAGKTIKGPSVRLAEIAIACYGNIKAGAQIVNNDGRNVTARAFCFDLENNVTIAIEKNRKITNREGKTFSEDMQTTTSNAACSIALRDAIFKVVPLALVKPIYEKAMQVAIGDAKSLSERRTVALNQLSKVTATEDMVLYKLGYDDIEQITNKDLENLFGMFTAIKDGESTVDELFSAVVEEVNPETGEVKSATDKLADKIAPKPAPAKEDLLGK